MVINARTLLTIYSSSLALSTPSSLALSAPKLLVVLAGLASSWLLKLAVGPTELIPGASARSRSMVLSSLVVSIRPRWTAER